VLNVYIGYDSREDEAHRVCSFSLRHHSTVPLHVVPLRQPALRALGLYTRSSKRNGEGKLIDVLDGKPFSTEFSFTRFLVPSVAGFQGRALFVDCDFLFRADVAELDALCVGDRAVWCVKHRHEPIETVKMDGRPQEHYRRKNWSSFVLWDCAHPANAIITPRLVNTRAGSWLHAFSWLPDELIGDIPEAWNWLEGYSPKEIDPKAVHFTRGGPWFEKYAGVAYADEWRKERERASQGD